MRSLRSPRVYAWGEVTEGRCSGALNAGAIVIRASTTLIMRLAIVLTEGQGGDISALKAAFSVLRCRSSELL